MLTRLEGEFAAQGYGFVMNQDTARRPALQEGMLKQYARLDDFLRYHAEGDSPFLFEDFGWSETVFTPLFMRFWFLDHYEQFTLPREPAFERVRAWEQACLAHPAAQQVSREQIVKLYYDYSRGAGNGALLPGRSCSSFAFEPDWRSRPLPPRGKEGPAMQDRDLGLA
jgi:glutathione S-transferase